ncbi:restriction endonuclease subunit S [Rhodosalinus sp. K401]|uniref:restriction endonuclease subunit S n=1 Tax=Rhodosalinus sp. K401 TaxID=3239195 RepID=UPI003525A4F9
MNAERLLALYEKVAEAPDAVPRLRRFVLDLAVRGKLVPQEADDEPASVLLKRIAAEKARLVNAKTIRKPRAVSPLEPDDLPFPLPRGWAWTQIAELGVISPRNEADDTLEASFVPMPLIAAEYGVANGHEPRPWGEIKKGYTHFAEGDVGLAKITPCFENGKSTVFRNLTGGIGAGTTELHVVRPLFVDADYILLFLKSPQFIETGIPRMTGTAGQKRVPTEYFTSSPFPLPPLAEQRRIVAKVEELMALLDRLEAARGQREATRDRLTAASLARLTAPDTDAADFPTNARFALATLPALTTRPDQIKPLRQTILNLAVRGKLVEQDPTDEPASELLKRIAEERDRLLRAKEIKKQKPILPVDESEAPYDVPRSWRWARFNEIAAIQSNLVDPKGYPDMPHIAPDNIEGWTARLLPYVSVRDAGVFSGKHLFAAGSILYSKIRPNLAKVTVADFDGLCSADMYPVRAHIFRDFLIKFMITEAFVDQSVSEDNRVAMPKINQAALSNILIPLPPLAEQHRIVAKVDALMALCDRLEAALTTTDTTRARLLEALLHEALEPGAEAVTEAAE